MDTFKVFLMLLGFIVLVIALLLAGFYLEQFVRGWL